ncbi:hypothetical protein O0S10_10395, partial [Methanocorpusculum sp. MG]
MNGMKCPRDTGGLMRRGVVLLAALLLVCTLMAGAVSATAETAAEVSNYAELIQNLSEKNSTIILMNDIEATAPILINYSVTIEGQYHTIKANNSTGGFTKSDHGGKCDRHLLCTGSSGITEDKAKVNLTNITFENYNENGGAWGIQFLNESTTPNTDKYHMITLKNVLINGSSGSGLTLKSENLTAVNLTIQNSAWQQSIDVEAQKAVNPTWLRMDETTYTNLKDLTKISNEGETPATVIKGENSLDPTHSWFLSEGNTYAQQRLVWAAGDNYATQAASGIFNASVQNTTSGTTALHANLTKALNNYVADDATVTQLKDVELSSDPILISKNITFDGGKKLITAKNPTLQGSNHYTAVYVTGKSVTLKNLNLVADEDFKEPDENTQNRHLTAIYVTNTGTNDGAFTLSDSTLNMSKAKNGNQTMVVRVAGTYKTVTITNNSIHGAESTNGENHKPVGNHGTSFGIAVEGASISEGLTIKENIIYPGIAGNSGSIGMRTYDLKQAPTNGIVIDKNTIDFTYANGGEYFSGIHMDQVNHQLSSATLAYTITNNTIQSLKEGNITTIAEDSYKNAGIYLRKVNATTGTTITLDMHDNSISGKLSENNKTTHNVTAFYANNVTFGASTIYNNTFNIENSNVLNYVHLTDVTTQDQIKWNSTGSDKQHAGNWWGTWSASKKSTTGYMTFADEATAKTAGLPVADLRPLVTEGTPTSTITITGNLSIENITGKSETLTATFTGGVSADFTWTVGTNGIINLNTNSGSSVTYSPVQIGTTNLTVKYGDVSKVVIITVYNTTAPSVDTEVKTEADGKVNLSVSTESKSTITAVKNDKGEATAAVITDPSSNTKIVLTYTEPAAVTGTEETITSVSGTIAKMVAAYPESEAPVSADMPVPAKYALNITLNASKALKDGANIILPIIDPAIKQEVVTQITSKNSNHKPLAMITASASSGTTIEQINSNISGTGIELKIIIPKEGKPTLGKLKALHISGNTITEDIFHVQTIGDNWVITIYGKSFSTHALVEDTTPTPPASSGGSGSGNMDGALRVLFNDGSATLSVVTGLS